MQLKSGVKATGVRPEILLALMIAREVYREHFQMMTVTSLNDSDHKENSLHYEGLAVDLRTKDLKDVTANTIVSELKERLGPDYDVILEKDPAHIHIEFDPKV